MHNRLWRLLGWLQCVSGHPGQFPVTRNTTLQPVNRCACYPLPEHLAPLFWSALDIKIDTRLDTKTLGNLTNETLGFRGLT